MTYVGANAGYDDIDRSIEEERSRVRETLAELEARVSPAALYDGIADNFGRAMRSGSRMGERMGERARANPATLAAIGAGLGLLAVASMKGDSDRVRRAASTARRKGDRLAADASERARRARIRAETGMETARTRAEARVESGRLNMRRRADRMGANGRDMGEDLGEMFRDNPLASGALAFAAGAAFGALTPNTRMEDDAFGDAGREARRRAARAALGEDAPSGGGDISAAAAERSRSKVREAREAGVAAGSHAVEAAEAEAAKRLDRTS